MWRRWVRYWWVEVVVCGGDESGIGGWRLWYVEEMYQILVSAGSGV